VALPLVDPHGPATGRRRRRGGTVPPRRSAARRRQRLQPATSPTDTIHLVSARLLQQRVLSRQEDQAR
jgi:hypothetical protein